MAFGIRVRNGVLKMLNDSGKFRKEVFKFGHGHNLQTADLPTDLWEGSAGLYPFQDDPVELFISCAEAADVGIPVQMEGLDKNWRIQRQIAITNGQSQVAFPGLWRRQYRAINADTGLPFTGNIYIAETDTLTGGVPDTPGKTKIIIEPDFQQTQMLVYTTPSDYTAKMKNIFLSLVPKTTAVAYAKLGIYMRQPGKAWTNQGYMGLISSGTSAIQIHDLEHAGVINPITDIVVRAIELSANGMEIAGSFTIDFKRKVS